MISNYVVYGDYVVTMNENMDVIKDGAVAVQGNKIVAVGPSATIFKKYPEAVVVGGKGHVVMPGLINTHNHAAMVNLRGIGDDLPLKEWLENFIWPAEKKFISPEYVADGMALACLEMLKGGTTTFADMYFYGDTLAQVAKNIGLRAVIGETVFDFPSATGQNADDYLKIAEKFILAWKNDDLIIPSVAAHAAYTCCPETLKKTEALAEKFNVPLQIHIAETAWEVSEIQNRYGKCPTEHLEAIGLLDANVIAAHCVWTNPNEIEILAKRQVGVAHCIESNLKLASGFAPIPEMLKAGVKVSIGTDGAASNNDLNMFTEISTAAKVHKAVKNDSTVMDAKTVILMATKMGARALGISNLGFLAPNCLADIITLDFQKPHLIPMFDVYSHLVYAAAASDVANVMVNGKVLLHNGSPKTCDQDEILDKARVWNQKVEKAINN